MTQSLARDLGTLVFGVPVLFELVVGLLVVGAIRARNLRTLGRVLAAERPGRGLRRAGFTVLLLGVFALVLLVRADMRVVEFAGLLLVPALGVVWLGNGFQDAVLGESGVQRGWSSRRFDELGEWRFTDERLCFRLQGEWTDVPCPKALQERLGLPR
jgi:hypothetical protein